MRLKSYTLIVVDFFLSEKRFHFYNVDFGKSCIFISMDLFLDNFKMIKNCFIIKGIMIRRSFIKIEFEPIVLKTKQNTKRIRILFISSAMKSKFLITLECNLIINRCYIYVYQLSFSTLQGRKKTFVDDFLLMS